jgi:glucose 1-dehydrogenase
LADQSLKGQNAIVTGASSGIGEGVAKALGAAGAVVVVNFPSNAAAADAVVKDIVSNGG